VEANTSKSPRPIPKLDIDLPGESGGFALSLFMVAAECGTLEKLEDDVKRLAEVAKGAPEFEMVLHNPLLRPEKKKLVLDAVCKELQLTAVVKNALNILVDDKKEKLLWDIVRDVHLLFKSYRKEHTAVLYTKSLLSPEKLQEYRSLINHNYLTYDSKLELENKTDPTIVEGYRLVIDNKAPIDNTYNTQIEEVVKAVKQELRIYFDSKQAQFPPK